jgi:hypothetical protein
MNDFSTIALIALLAFFLGVVAGVKGGADIAPSDCEKLGKFQHADKAYVCTLETKASAK